MGQSLADVKKSIFMISHCLVAIEGGVTFHIFHYKTEA